MESALRMLLQTTFGEYVTGLDNVDASKFPLTLRDLKLREKKIQEELDDESNFPFNICGGSIGSVSLNPGWMGTVEIIATNIVLNFTFNPIKAMRAITKREDSDRDSANEQQARHRQCAPEATLSPVAGRSVAPRYCDEHGTSQRRTKVEPRLMSCTGCRTTVQTNYSGFVFCPSCSEREKRCMICGARAPVPGSHVPAGSLTPQARAKKHSLAEQHLARSNGISDQLTFREKHSHSELTSAAPTGRVDIAQLPHGPSGVPTHATHGGTRWQDDGLPPPPLLAGNQMEHTKDNQLTWAGGRPFSDRGVPIRPKSPVSHDPFYETHRGNSLPLPPPPPPRLQTLHRQEFIKAGCRPHNEPRIPDMESYRGHSKQAEHCRRLAQVHVTGKGSFSRSTSTYSRIALNPQQSVLANRAIGGQKLRREGDAMPRAVNSAGLQTRIVRPTENDAPSHHDADWFLDSLGEIDLTVWVPCMTSTGSSEKSEGIWKSKMCSGLLNSASCKP